MAGTHYLLLYFVATLVPRRLRVRGVGLDFCSDRGLATLASHEFKARNRSAGRIIDSTGENNAGGGEKVACMRSNVRLK